MSKYINKFEKIISFSDYQSTTPDWNGIHVHNPLINLTLCNNVMNTQRLNYGFQVF